MKYIYTATFVPNEDGSKYYCRVPDLPGCITIGASIDDAIEMITDAASGWLAVAEDEGNEIPAATPQNRLDIPENAICSIIRIDTFAFLPDPRRNPGIPEFPCRWRQLPFSDRRDQQAVLLRQGC